ncbi:MAG TPA: hypothetical protein PLY08_08065, partial [Bacillota bacterium]|nr:hypothetical protein [Bacillota bacterium]
PCSFYLSSFAPIQAFRGAIGAESAAGWPQGHFSVPLLLLFEQFCTDTGLSRRGRCGRISMPGGHPAGILTPSAAVSLSSG